MKRRVRTVIGLTNKLVELLAIQSELFMAERPHLWQEGEVFACDNLEERIEENQKAICKVRENLIESLAI